MKTDKKTDARIDSSFIPHPSSFRAFTLVEMLVVIGIITILIGFLLPAVLNTMKKAGATRIRADLKTIETALDAYKQDFGDIPRIPVYPPTWTDPTLKGTPIPNTGAAILAKALLGPFGDGFNPPPNPADDTNDPPQYDASIKTYKPGDVVRDTAKNFYVCLVENPGAVPPSPLPAVQDWAYFDPHDGADGPGFRLQLNYDTGVTGPAGKIMIATGKTWGPYLQAGNFKSRGALLMDHLGNPILYFPARPGAINLTQNPASGAKPYVDSRVIIVQGATPPQSVSLYNVDDNFEAFRRRNPVVDTDETVRARVRIMLNDFNSSGVIDVTNSQTEVEIRQSYLLWSAGSDGILGPAKYTPLATPGSNDVIENRKAVEKCDDVTNFR